MISIHISIACCKLYCLNILILQGSVDSLLQQIPVCAVLVCSLLTEARFKMIPVMNRNYDTFL